MDMNELVETTLERVKGSTEELDTLRVKIDEISKLRTEDIVELRNLGVTREVIADAAGLTPARVTQILGRVGESNRPRAPKVYVPVAKKAPKPAKARKPLPPEPHRHHYVPIAWNHSRGNYMVRQRCDCGDVRVIPAASLPPAMKQKYPDASVVA
jgi:hypothetical protein